MKHIAVDFDGVLAHYDGWKGAEHFGEILGGAESFLKSLKALGFEVIIHTTRDPGLIWSWLRFYSIDSLVQKVTDKKLPAVVYLDDRGVCFRGNYEEALEAIKTFSPWWEKK